MNSLVANRPEDVTVDFLNQVIPRHDAYITTAECEAFGTGQIATTLRVSLTWSSEDPNHPTHVIVKLAGVDAGRREASRRQATFRREVEFYRELAPQLTLATPRCLYAASHATTGSMTIVLLEVTGRRGNQLAGCGIPDAESVVESAVRLHAPFWNRPELLSPFDWLAPDGPEAAEVRGDRYRQLVRSFADQYQRRLDTEVLDTAFQLGEAIEAVTTHRRSPVCLTHGDFRLDNLIFVDSSERTTAVVVDWQTVGAGSGPADLAFALGSGLSTDLRRRHEIRLLNLYADGLNEGGVDIVRADVEHDYRLGAAEGLVMAVIASQVVTHTDRGDEMFAVMAELHALQMHDLGTLQLLR